MGLLIEILLDPSSVFQPAAGLEVPGFHGSGEQRSLLGLPTAPFTTPLDLAHSRRNAHAKNHGSLLFASRIGQSKQRLKNTFCSWGTLLLAEHRSAPGAVSRAPKLCGLTQDTRRGETPGKEVTATPQTGVRTQSMHLTFSRWLRSL